MGSCMNRQIEDKSNEEIKANDIFADEEETKPITRNKRENFVFAHSKHYERYFNRQYKVSVCSAQGERKKMEDDHLCQFIFSNHAHYSLFGLFDGHNGSKASQYLAENLYETLNNLKDLNNNQDIIASIKEMDKQFLSTSDDNTSGSTIVFVIIYSDFDAVVNMDTLRTLSLSSIEKNTICDSHVVPSIETDKKNKLHHKLSYGQTRMLPGFEMKHNARIFWCGDSRGFLVHSSEIENAEKEIKYDVLTNDHNTKNEMEIKRIKSMNGNIINGRVDGKLAVTRSFGDNRMKYDGSVVISDCEYNEFAVNVGDSLLLCCDGLIETWNDKTLIERLLQHLDEREKHKTDTDTVKAIGDLVDDAIYEGSNDNITAMLIQFKDGTKQKTNSKYQNVKSLQSNV